MESPNTKRIYQTCNSKIVKINHRKTDGKQIFSKIFTLITCYSYDLLRCTKSNLLATKILKEITNRQKTKTN